MKKIFNSFLIISFLFIFFQNIAISVSCDDLKTTKKISQFIEKSYLSSPLLQKNISLTLSVDACENKGCKSKKKRSGEKEILHILKYKNKSRIFAEKGPNAPRCVIKRGGRRFICSSCGAVSNENCRSFPSDENSIFPGTNIDTEDFKLTSKFGKESRCSKLKNPNFFKIETKIDEGKSGSNNSYEKVISFYDKKKGVHILMNFYAENVLRKVYRFYPKYYVKVGSQWFSSVMRVRTTLGSEKKFIFETLTHVNKKNGRLKLYLNISDDPNLKNVPPESLFSTD